MSFKSDIEIAQEATMQDIREIVFFSIIISYRLLYVYKFPILSSKEQIYIVFRQYLE